MIRSFRALSRARKVLTIVGVLLAPLFIVSAVSPTPDMQKAAQINRAEITPAAVPSEGLTTEPIQTDTKTVTETLSIPYTSTTQQDESLEAGKTAVLIPGVNGEKAVTYSITYTGGRETARTVVSEQITKQPVNEVKKLGTKAVAVSSKDTVKRNHSGEACDKNYAPSPCVPIASDVDCAGGSGNGPAFVHGPVQIIGIDIYHLDKNGDGVGCE